jgi:hypothetical protein
VIEEDGETKAPLKASAPIIESFDDDESASSKNSLLTLKIFVFLNALAPILWTVHGILPTVRFVHPANASSPINDV